MDKLCGIVVGMLTEAQKPLCVDLYCGLGGWAEGFLSEGYEVHGYDIEAHDYGTGGYPGTLFIRDVRSLHGSQFKDAAVIVGSSPCQEFSYRAMPWKRAKALPPPYLGIELFQAQFRIQREASEAAGRYIPLIVENVRGAQKWVGRARWNYGSFYLWGDVPALMPITASRTVMKAGVTHRSDGSTNFHGQKVGGTSNIGSNFSWNLNEEFQAQRREGSTEGRKVGKDWFGGYGGGFGWDCSPMRRNNSKSKARKAASAMIAKIPLPLAQHIARSFYPKEVHPC